MRNECFYSKIIHAHAQMILNRLLEQFTYLVGRGTHCLQLSVDLSSIDVVYKLQLDVLF